jgi:hypothetical protein
MKLSKLLTNRAMILRRAYLANLAGAYHTLSAFSQRIARARLGGLVNLKHAEMSEERYWPALRALEGNQSVIDEHFTDEDILELADAVAFATDEEALDLDFQLEELYDKFAAPLRFELERAGVTIDLKSPALNARRKQRTGRG